MKLHRKTIWLVPLLCILTFPLWSPPVGHFLTPRGGFDPDLKKPPTDTHSFSMQTVKILQNQNGRNTALIRASQAHTAIDDNDTLIMEKVDADIFDENNNITHILAREGKYSTNTKILTLIGNVVVNKIADKQWLYTELLYYDSDKRTVNCPGKTRLKNDSAVVDGGSLDYNVTTQQYVIGKRVNCDINGFVQP